MVRLRPISRTLFDSGDATMGEDLAPSLGDGKNFADQIFEWPFLGKYFQFDV